MPQTMIPPTLERLRPSNFFSLTYTFKISSYAPEIYTNLENLLLTTVAGGDFSSERSSTWNCYGSGINLERLETQLTILKIRAQESSIASVLSIIEFLNANGPASFSETATGLVKLILLMPATNALRKRSFSATTVVPTHFQIRSYGPDIERF